MSQFEEFNLSEQVVMAVAKMGFEAATPIQAQAIPLALEGRDVIGQAQTGTGKTAAFGIPMIENIREDKDSIQGLIVAPTRELAVQVAEEINTIAQLKRVKALPIYGGQDILRQIRGLKNRPQIIVGTPGRLLDHIRRRTIRLNEVSMVVLDEADEMLNMGFIEDIELILEETPEERQTMLFSATMPEAIRALAKRFMRSPEFIRIKPLEVTVPNTEQYYVQVPEIQKFEVLCRILDMHSPEQAIIFCRTKKRVDELEEALGKRGYLAEGIHGDLTQARRDSVMGSFRKGNNDILVATDVAARGLDIGSVTHVYNFDIPQDPESYVHRIGRTGRLGKEGIALTLVTPREFNQLKLIERTIKRRIQRQDVPTAREALEGQQLVAAAKLVKIIKEDTVEHYGKMAETLLEEYNPVSLVAAALKVLTREPDTTPVTITPDNYQRREEPYQDRHKSRPYRSYGHAKRNTKRTFKPAKK